MNEIAVKPDRGQRTVWLIHWSLWFFPILFCSLVLMVINPLLFGLCALGWILFMLPLVLWLGAYFRSLDYTLAGDVVKGRRGVLFKRSVTMPVHKITNVDITHGPLQRKFGVGYIHCQTAGAGGQQGARAELKMEGIRDLEKVKDTILERVRETSMTRTGAIKPQTAAAQDSNVMTDILAELRAIREVLKEKA